MAPSLQPGWEQKLYSLTSLPVGLISNTAPSSLAPPAAVVPKKLPFVPCTKGAAGYAGTLPSVLSKLAKVVSCAGAEIDAAQNRRRIKAMRFIVRVPVVPYDCAVGRCKRQDAGFCKSSTYEEYGKPSARRITARERWGKN